MKQAAAKDFVSVNEWIRRAILQKLTDDNSGSPTTPEYEKLTKELDVANKRIDYLEELLILHTNYIPGQKMKDEL